VRYAIYSADGAQSKLNFTPDRPIAERFTRIERWWDRRDRRWVLHAWVDRKCIVVTGSQLFYYEAVRAAAIEQEGIYLPPVAETEWEEVVKLRVEETCGEWMV
jgi:hypothetical protein